MVPHLPPLFSRRVLQEHHRGGSSGSLGRAEITVAGQRRTRRAQHPSGRLAGATGLPPLSPGFRAWGDLCVARYSLVSVIVPCLAPAVKHGQVLGAYVRLAAMASMAPGAAPHRNPRQEWQSVPLDGGRWSASPHARQACAVRAEGREERENEPPCPNADMHPSAGHGAHGAARELRS